MEGADLTDSYATIRLEGADLRGAHLEGADLRGAHLELANLVIARLTKTNFTLAHLKGANFNEAHLEEAILDSAHLEGAEFRRAHLKGAKLAFAHLEKAVLEDAHLEKADLNGAYLQGANLYKSHLEGTILSRVVFDNETSLDNIDLGHDKYGPASLADIRWGDVNIAVVDWAAISKLGDERTARKREGDDGEIKNKQQRLEGYRTAVRANRQLAVVLRDQGLNEVADRFAYRAQVLQQKLFWKQKNFGRGFFSGFLYLVAGYGYRIWRIFVAYGLLICIFAAIYYFSPGSGHHLTWYQQVYQAFVVSITAFHGRTYTGQYGPDTALGGVAAGEGILGLVIEGVFIAMLVQRFFGR